MLQRAPECRASLDDIAYDPWLGGSGGDAHAQSNYAIPMDEQLPLVAREHLSEEDHANILKRMVVGKIASQVKRVTGINAINDKKYVKCLVMKFFYLNRTLLQ